MATKPRNFIVGEYYHLFNKSIAHYRIFSEKYNYCRFLQLINYYNSLEKNRSFSDRKPIVSEIVDLLSVNSSAGVKIIAYCVMPTHYHLLVKILQPQFISDFMSKLENSYSRYFNLKTQRKGPLWQSRFQSKRIKNDTQLLHLTRYIHLNPTTSYLVEKPQDWPFSSYSSYLTKPQFFQDYLSELTISNKKTYQKFVENRLDYQRKLKLIKKLIFE